MADRTHSASRTSLTPAGHRWGRGAQSIVPYLAAARARPAPAPEGEGEPEAERIANPVFRHMEIRLAWRDR